jgi:hypothetical protein
MDYEQSFPLLWNFFNGAFQANSGGRVKDDDFKDFQLMIIAEAEDELNELCNGNFALAAQLGMLADGGYTMWGQTKQGRPGGNDEQHKLRAYEMLDVMY